MSQLLVNEETLEALTYERSKIWSNFLKRCEENEDGVEIDLNNIDEVYRNQDEESVEDIEEAEEDAVEDDINNTTACMSKAELTLMLCSGDNKEILNQTLPIVEEHVRKWKEAGLDRILNTFDAQKIEQHVGDWLRRHNSAYGDKTLQASPKSIRKCHKFPKRRDTSSNSNDSEAESMHSVDTARYIRASRKRTVSSASKCSISPMTTIKMYRTMPRMRDELRAKYGCDDYSEEQEHRHHMQVLRHRRDQLHRRKREQELIYHASPRHYPYSVAGSFHGQQRRKQLRKRRDNSPLFASSSSSEDEGGDSRCDCRACMRRTFSMTSIPYCAYRSYRSHSIYRHQHIDMDSRSTHSVFRRNVCQIRRKHAFEKDMRPRLLENECNCCNNDRLCSKVVHIANSSTEDWMVENKSSPDTITLSTAAKASTSRKSINQKLKSNIKLKARPKSAPADSDEDTSLDGDVLETSSILEADKKSKTNPQTRAIVKFHNMNDSLQKSTSKTIVHKGTPKPKLQKVEKNKIKTKAQLVSVSEEEETEAGEETSEKLMELSRFRKTTKTGTISLVRFSSVDGEMASKDAAVKDTPKTRPEHPKNLLSNDKALLESSQESVRKHVEQISSPERDKVLANKRQMPSSAKKRNATRKTGQSKKVNNKLHKVNHGAKSKKKVERIQQLDNESDNSNRDSDAELQKALILSKQTYLQDLEKCKLSGDIKVDGNGSSSPQLPEQSSFNVHSVACNSTTISNTTCTRALMEKVEKSIVEQTKRWSGMEGGFAVSDGDADCTVVTSTTNCEPATGSGKPITATVEPQPSIKLTKKGILLHAPSDRNQSCSSSHFTLTEECLIPIIGQKKARKLLKYHMSSRSFDSRHTVYYRPTAKMAAFLSSGVKSVDYNSSSSSGSDDDIFDRVQRYGEVFSVLEKGHDD